MVYLATRFQGKGMGVSWNENVREQKAKILTACSGIDSYRSCGGTITCFPTIINLYIAVCVLQVSGLYEYKIMGSISDVLPDVCKQVYMDLEYRKNWDEYVNGKMSNFGRGSTVTYTAVISGCRSQCSSPTRVLCDGH